MVPPEYQDDPYLYWAIQASLGDGGAGGNEGPSGPGSGQQVEQNNHYAEDPLDIMINNQ